MPWERVSRRGIATKLDVDHLMASVAIPLLFPAVEMAGVYSQRRRGPAVDAACAGDPPRRGPHPRDRRAAPRACAAPMPANPPNMAEQFGFLLDSLFMEGLQADLERLNRDQRAAAALPVRPGASRHAPASRRWLVLPEAGPGRVRDRAPGFDAGLTACVASHPRRARRAGGKLLSYLLFEVAIHARVDRGSRRARRKRAAARRSRRSSGSTRRGRSSRGRKGREAHDVGDGRQDHAAGERRVDAKPLQRHRDQSRPPSPRRPG